MGIDYEKFANAASDSKVQREIDKIRKNLGDRKIILSIDRLDYTKSIPQRLEAFDLFLDKYPEFKAKNNIRRCCSSFAHKSGTLQVVEKAGG